MIGISFLALALLASTALGVATAYLVVYWSKRPVLWALAPVFVLLWIAAGLTSFGLFAYSVRSAPAPVAPFPPPPVPVEVAPVETSPSP